MGRVDTRVVKVNAYAPEKELVKTCAEVLRRGGLVAFPTETVYGLGANALDPGAVRRIFEAKGRPSDNPLIVHVARLESVEPLVTEVPPLARNLMHLFWPGPLTILFPRSSFVPDEVTAGLPTVAIRMPDHPVAQMLIDLAGVPVAAPSANLSGRPSPTSPEDVYADLYGKVDIIIDGGPTDIGIESTVLDITSPVPRILRPGGLSVEELRLVLGEVQVVPEAVQATGTPPSPGMKYRHYAPNAEVYLATGSERQQGAGICLNSLRLLFRGKKVAVLGSTENASGYHRLRREFPNAASRFFPIDLGSRKDLAPVAARLFSSLRYADQLGADVIFAETFPTCGLGLAISNRLTKASAGKTLADLEQKPFTVLLVCSGNTCRSPMAEGMLRVILEGTVKAGCEGCPGGAGKVLPVRVFSRGTSAVPGMPATPEAVAAAARFGADIKGHVSLPVTSRDMDEADLVVTMTSGHKNALTARFPDYAGKVYTLSELVPEKVKGDVPDPIGLGQEVYDRTACILKDGLTALAEKIFCGFFGDCTDMR